MALSNIFREPRREITESIVGTAAAATLVGAVLWLDYAVVSRICKHCTHTEDFAFAMFIGVFVIVVGAVLLGGAMVALHALGEELCDWLDDRGLQLRPRERPGELTIEQMIERLTQQEEANAAAGSIMWVKR